MIRTIADPWLAQNAGRRYPLADDSDTTIPNNAILDFRCTVRGVTPGRTPVARIFYIGSRNDQVLGPVKYADVEILDGRGGDRIGVLRFDVPRSRVQTAHYTAVASGDAASGRLTVQYPFTTIPYGAFSAEFSSTTVVADSLGVDSVQGVPSVSYDEPGQHHIDGPSVVLTGDVVLDAGANADPYLDGNRLRLEIAKGYGRGEWCQRQKATQNCGNVLFSINGERPGSDGSMRLVGEGGVIITPDQDGHALVITIGRPAADMLASDCTVKC